MSLGETKRQWFPTFRRFGRRLFTRRNLRITLFIAVCLITLIALFYAVENWRGHRVWKRAEATLKEKGEPLNWEALVPPPIPAEENFAETPLLAPLFDYRMDREPVWMDPEVSQRADSLSLAKGEGEFPGLGSWQKGEPLDLEKWRQYFQRSANPAEAERDQTVAASVLAGLERYAGEMDELSRGIRERPNARYDIHYEEGIQVLLPHIALLRNAAQLFVLRGVAYLEHGAPEKAMEDMRTIVGLAETLREEPLLISQLVRAAILKRGLQVVWEGMARHQWTEEQLAPIAAMVTEIDMLGAITLGLRGERAIMIDVLEDLRNGRMPFAMDMENSLVPSEILKVIPDGWYLQNQARVALFCQEHIEAVELEAGRVSPRHVQEAEERVEDMLIGRTPYNLFAGMMLPALTQASLRFAQTQVYLDLVEIGTALERYRIRHGRFPDDLNALEPEIIKGLPPDLLTGKPYNYRREENGYRLYSLGWNLEDNGGKTVVRHDAVQPREGDWVWVMPGDAGPD